MDCLCRGGNVCEKLLLLLQGLLHLHFCKCGKMYEENMHFLPIWFACFLVVVAWPALTHYGKITVMILSPLYQIIGYFILKDISSCDIFSSDMAS